MLKTFLGSFMTPQRLSAQLREARQQAERLRSELTAIVERLDARGPGPAAFGRASARYGLLHAEATIAWTEEAQAMLDHLVDHQRPGTASTGLPQ